MIKYRDFVYSLFLKNKSVNNGNIVFNYDSIKSQLASSLNTPIFSGNSSRFKSLFKKIEDKEVYNHAAVHNSPDITSNSVAKKLFNTLVEVRIVAELYENAAKWPFIMWDEYYDDGTPATLNWELVTNNLANVYTKDVLTQASSTISANEAAVTPRRTG